MGVCWDQSMIVTEKIMGVACIVNCGQSRLRYRCLLRCNPACTERRNARTACVCVNSDDFHRNDFDACDFLHVQNLRYRRRMAARRVSEFV